MTFCESKKNIEHKLGFRLIRDPNYNNSQKDDYLLNRLGHSNLNQEQIRKSIEIVIKGIRSHKKDEILWALLGYLYYTKGNFSKSIRCFFKTIEINPSNIDNWIDLGFAYRAYGDTMTSDFIFINYKKMVEIYKKQFTMINKNILWKMIQHIR